jgi:hypothetical protein
MLFFFFALITIMYMVNHDTLLDWLKNIFEIPTAAENVELNSHALLVGMQNNAAILENILATS